MSIEERLARLERQNHQLRLGLLSVVAALAVGCVALIGATTVNAQAGRVLSAEGLIIEKNGVRYGSFGINTDGNVIFEMRRQAPDGWRMIYAYVSGDASTMFITGPGDGSPSVSLRANGDGSGGVELRGPGKNETVWTAP